MIMVWRIHPLPHCRLFTTQTHIFSLSIVFIANENLFCVIRFPYETFLKSNAQFLSPKLGLTLDSDLKVCAIRCLLTYYICCDPSVRKVPDNLLSAGTFRRKQWLLYNWGMCRSFQFVCSRSMMPGPAVIPRLLPDATPAEHQGYRRDVLKLPGSIDRWLTANSHSPRIDFLKDYLLLGDVKAEYVDCVVKSVCVKKVCHLLSCINNCFHLFAQESKDDPTCEYMLYITACASPDSHMGPFLSQSPQAVLERFIGSRDAIDAPEWTRWTRSTLEFQQPKATFIELFIRMAEWDNNKKQVRLKTHFVSLHRSH